MTDANDRPVVSVTIDAAAVAALYEDHAPELRRFVLGVTRDPELAADVLQTTFARVVEVGHSVRSESFKGWLFRVAFNEALTARRRREARDRGLRRLADLGLAAVERPDERLIRRETVTAVRDALDRLPQEQHRVVWQRIYEDKTFAEIAEEDGLPLGTVLTRMRLALDKLRRTLRAGD
jgi:RNA polymerase sigma-70 factor (ECF subfamily)